MDVFRTLLALQLLYVGSVSSSALGEYVKDYAPLNYNKELLAQRHAIRKRSIYSEGISLPLLAFGTQFDIVLYPDDDDSLLHPNTELVVDGKLHSFDKSHLYKGHLKGLDGSSISGSIVNGVFQGKIHAGDGQVFYVERKEYHQPHADKLDADVHSVMYRLSDVDVQKFYSDQRKKKAHSGSDSFCGNDANAGWMDRVKRSAVEEDIENIELESRKKRATVDGKKTCTLLLQSDPELWAYVKSTLGSEASDSMVTEEITALLKDLMKEVSDIYRGSTFSGGHTGYSFRIDRIMINKTCSGNEHWFCGKNIDVSNFLNLNTYTNHNAFCLAYVFTYRDFADGTLGLAWVGEPGSTNGGICSTYKTYAESGGNRKKSLNTGIVTFKNYGSRVPKLMNSLTLAHEFGHNFGSNHDQTGQTPSCTPYTDSDNSDGNYIMYYAAIEGNRANNFDFSPCSKTAIGDVLSSSVNTACLIEADTAFCGNRILETEDGEECDCGYADDDDCPCCNGKGNVDDKDPCTKKISDTCDPSEGPCCENTCSFTANRAMCRGESECAESASCDGSGAKCPASVFKNDGILCNNHTQVCDQGVCNASICTRIGWEACELEKSESASLDALCYVSCKDPSDNKCYSSFDYTSIPQTFQSLLDGIPNNNRQGVPRKPGQSCDKEKGFCDYFQSCRIINDKGPLSRLKNLLLSLTSSENLVAWLQQYWWAVLLIVLGLALFMGLLVKFGTVFTPSSNPDKSPARKLSKPLTRPERPNRSSRNDGLLPTQSREAAGPHVGGRYDDMEMH